MGCLKAQCKRVTQFQALFRKCTNHPTNNLTPGLKFEKYPFSQPKYVRCWFILEKVAGIVITKFLLFFSFFWGRGDIFENCSHLASVCRQVVVPHHKHPTPWKRLILIKKQQNNRKWSRNQHYRKRQSRSTQPTQHKAIWTENIRSIPGPMWRDQCLFPIKPFPSPPPLLPAQI